MDRRRKEISTWMRKEKAKGWNENENSKRNRKANGVFKDEE